MIKVKEKEMEFKMPFLGGTEITGKKDVIVYNNVVILKEIDELLDTLSKKSDLSKTILINSLIRGGLYYSKDVTNAMLNNS